MLNNVTERTAGGVNWRRAIVAGLVAGLVLLILEMMMVPLFLGRSPWGPPRLIAAIVLGQGVLPPPTTFDLGVVLVAMMVHFVMSAIFGVILALIIHRLSPAMAVIVGAAYGLLLYLVNFYVFTAIFHWFANARNWVSIFTHTVFGLVAAWIHKKMIRNRAPV